MPSTSPWNERGAAPAPLVIVGAGQAGAMAARAADPAPGSGGRALPAHPGRCAAAARCHALGRGGPDLAYHLRGSLPAGRDAGKAMLFGVRDGRLARVIAINAGGDLRTFRDALERPLACAPQALCDAQVPAKQLARLALGPAGA